MICLGSVRKVETAKCQNLTLQVEKTAVEKWEGIMEKRIISTTFKGAVRICIWMRGWKERYTRNPPSLVRRAREP